MKKRGLNWLFCLVMMLGVMIGSAMSVMAAPKPITWGSDIIEKIDIGSWRPKKEFSASGITAVWSAGNGMFYTDEEEDEIIIGLQSSDACIKFNSTVGKIKNITISCGLYQADNGSKVVTSGFNIPGWTFSGMTSTGMVSSSCTVIYNGSPAESVSLTGLKKAGLEGLGIEDVKSITFTFATPVTGVSLNKTSTSLTVGGTEALAATVTPSDATNKTVTWSSSNSSVATVDSSGTVTAVAPGTATITATTNDGSKTATCTVTVADKITITKTSKLKKVKVKKGTVTISWQKIKKTKKTKALLKKIRSIQVQYSTDPSFTTHVVSKNVGKNKTKVKLKLQRKTVYYVRMRYAAKDGGFSKWSNRKTVKTK